MCCLTSLNPYAAALSLSSLSLRLSCLVLRNSPALSSTPLSVPDTARPPVASPHALLSFRPVQTSRFRNTKPAKTHLSSCFAVSSSSAATRSHEVSQRNFAHQKDTSVSPQRFPFFCAPSRILVKVSARFSPEHRPDFVSKALKKLLRASPQPGERS